MLQERSNPATKRRSALLGVALARRRGVGVVAAVALGLGDDRDRRAPTPTPRRDRRRRRRRPEPTSCASTTRSRVGRRPNVVRVVGDNVFVGSFRSDRLQHRLGQDRQGPLLRAAGRRRRQRRRVRRSARCGSRSRATNQLVRLDAAHRPPGRQPDQAAVPARRGRRRPRTRSGSALVPGNGRARHAASSSIRGRAQTLATRRLPVRDRVARRRARPRSGSRPAAARAIQRVDLETGEVVQDDPRRPQPHRGHRLPRRRAVGRRRPRTTPSTRSAPRPATRSRSASASSPRQLALGDGRRLRHQLQLERPVRDRREALARRSATRSSCRSNPFSLARRRQRTTSGSAASPRTS